MLYIYIYIYIYHINILYIYIFETQFKRVIGRCEVELPRADLRCEDSPRSWAGDAPARFCGRYIFG